MVDRRLRTDPYVRFPGLESFLADDARYEPAGDDIVRPPPAPRLNPIHNAPPMPPWKRPPPDPTQPEYGPLPSSSPVPVALQNQERTPGGAYFSTAKALAT